LERENHTPIESPIKPKKLKKSSILISKFFYSSVLKKRNFSKKKEKFEKKRNVSKKTKKFEKKTKSFEKKRKNSKKNEKSEKKRIPLHVENYHCIITNNLTRFCIGNKNRNKFNDISRLSK
jgi:hypothetical protein